jgi:hypothetical protein
MKFFSCKKKSKDATELFDEVLQKVAPQLENSVNTLIDNERKERVSRALADMQKQLNSQVSNEQAQAQVQASQVPINLVKSQNAPFTLVQTTSANPEILQNVIQQLVPYLEDSVKTMITNERDLLIGTIVQHIQNNLNEKNQPKSD